MGGPVRLHELESSDGIEPISLASQAATFLRISRSSRSVLFSRRSRPALEMAKSKTLYNPCASSFTSTSASSSQNCMSISRYIVVAMVRCSRACSSLPVRR